MHESRSWAEIARHAEHNTGLVPVRRVLVFGAGYCGRAIARAAAAAGNEVTAASRDPAKVGLGDGIARYASAIAAAPSLAWIGYLSATSVYGDRGGGAVDEDTSPAPSSERGERRLAAERAWQACAGTHPLDLFRLAGIYGPGRSAFDQIRAGTARRIIAPGHAFSRIHRDDIVAAVLAAMHRPRERTRVLNLADDEPAESAAVLEEAARLLGVRQPPAIALAEALPAMSPMARSFWAEQRRISTRKTQEMLGITWRYPSYREGLAAILTEELSERGRKEGQVLRP